MLKVNNINVYYGKIHALKDVSFEVHEGEVVALIGANGAGKSTTLKTVSGMMHSRTGSIEFLGENITHTPSHKLVYKGLAHVPEGRRVFLQMSVLENLEMGAYIHKKPTREELDGIFQRFPRLHGAIGGVPQGTAYPQGVVVPQESPYLADDHRHTVGGESHLLGRVEVVDGLDEPDAADLK